MSRFVFKVPDLGEGTVSSEIVAWKVRPGDLVAEDQPLVEMSTDKAVVEVPAPVGGRIVSLAGEPGDVIAVGAELVVFETDSGAPVAAAAAPVVAAVPASSRPAAPSLIAAGGTPAAGGRLMASPATRRQAREAGIDLNAVSGSGPGGRITPADFASVLADKAVAQLTSAPTATTGDTTEIKVIGVRRVIAERMSEAKRTIPHFSYVEEIDVSELESLRAHLNAQQTKGSPALTYLPFIVAALVRVLRDFPQCNALYDASRGVIVRHRAVHVGLATQTPDGLKVPVVRNAQTLSLTLLASELRRVADAARTNKVRREELTGSTITVTSLGRLGGIASTPVINLPEVAIIGVNKAVDRPVVRHGAIAVRRIMNLSSSFDHRFVDGYDAAAMIQALRECLEHPATIFISA
jgi:2-oxoisovalerate dehydrogenase E2 component (dihydrolipoyl transacylase)